MTQIASSKACKPVYPRCGLGISMTIGKPSPEALNHRRGQPRYQRLVEEPLVDARVEVLAVGSHGVGAASEVGRVICAAAARVHRDLRVRAEWARRAVGDRVQNSAWHTIVLDPGH